MKKLYRCVNDDCDQKGHEFDAEASARNCPHCKMVQVQLLTPVHYFVPAEGPIKTGIGNRMIACQPNSPLPKAASGERGAVTCPACKASTLFAEDERDGVNNHVPVFDARHGATEPI